MYFVSDLLKMIYHLFGIWFDSCFSVRIVGPLAFIFVYRLELVDRLELWLSANSSRYQNQN